MGPRAIVGIQPLEQRVLMSVSAVDGEAHHQLEWIEWEGQQIEVVENELLVSLEPKGYMMNWLDNWVIDDTLCRAPRNGPEPWLIEAIEEVAPEVQFMEYGAFEHQFKVEIPEGGDYQALAEALSALPRFVAASPSFILYAGPVDIEPVGITQTAPEAAAVPSATAAESGVQFAVAPNPNISRAQAAPASRVLDAVFVDSVETIASLS